MAAEATTPPSAPPPTRSLTSGHLWQIDIVRLFAFTGVISVHSIVFTHTSSNQVAAGMQFLLQFGREVFFALTGFVLVYTARTRARRPVAFWRRRLPLVVVPYVAWTTIYYVYNNRHGTLTWSHYFADVGDGRAEYHLYFLLVTVQLYVVWPVLAWIVRRTAAHWKQALAVVGVANVAWMAALEYVATPTSGAGRWIFDHAYESLPTYLVYVLIGCYAAVHLDALQGWVDRHERRLVLASVAVLAAGIGVYTLQLQFMGPHGANSPLQPMMVLVSLAAAALFYVAGSRWAGGARRQERLIGTAGDISFGVYLAHPLVLDFFRLHGFGGNDQIVTPWLCTVVAFVGTVVGANLVSLVARSTPLSLPLTGRPWNRPSGRLGSGRRDAVEG